MTAAEVVMARTLQAANTGNPGTTTFPCNLGTLNPNQSATITSTFNVPSNLTGTSVTNTANVSSSIVDPNNTNNASAFTTNIVPATGNTPSADLKMFKSGPGQAATGSTFSFGVQILNNGPNDATNVVVTDPTPAGLTFVSNTGACTTPYPCNIGTVKSGFIVTIISTYSVQAAANRMRTEAGAPAGVGGTTAVTVVARAQLWWWGTAAAARPGCHRTTA